MRTSKTLLSVLVGLAASLIPWPANAIQYRATKLEAGGVRVQGWGINNLGQITGWAEFRNGGPHAFLHSGDAMHDLGTLGGSTSYGRAINDLGQVTGYSETAGNDPHGFIYSGGQMRSIGALTYGQGINAAGQITGYQSPSRGPFRVFLYTDGVIQDIGPGEGFGINDTGQITGSFFFHDGELSHAFIYSAGTIIDLGIVGGGVWINRSGQVAGGTPIGGYGRAFLYSGGTVSLLGTLGGNASIAWGGNSLGDVVGQADTARDDIHAFIFTAGNMHDLNDLVVHGLPTGAVLYAARSINDRGQIVADNGCSNVCETYRLDPIGDATSVAVPTLSDVALSVMVLMLLVSYVVYRRNEA